MSGLPHSYRRYTRLSLDCVLELQRLRMFVPAAETERVALQDDVIPLKTPVLTADGKVLNSIRIRKGQVCRSLEYNPWTCD